MINCTVLRCESRENHVRETNTLSHEKLEDNIISGDQSGTFFPVGLWPNHE